MGRIHAVQQARGLGVCVYANARQAAVLAGAAKEEPASGCSENREPEACGLAHIAAHTLDLAQGEW